MELTECCTGACGYCCSVRCADEVEVGRRSVELAGCCAGGCGCGCSVVVVLVPTRSVLGRMLWSYLGAALVVVVVAVVVVHTRPM